MLKHVTIALFLISQIFTVSMALAEVALIEAGNTTLQILLPKNFVALDMNSDHGKALQLQNPPSTKTLAVLTPKENYLQNKNKNFFSLEKYTMVKLSKSNEKATVKTADFDRFKQYIKKLNMEKALDNSTNYVNDYMKKNKSDFPDVQLGEAVSLGVFHESPSSISSLFMIRIANELPSGELEEVPMVVSMTTVLVGGKMLSVDSYSKYKNLSDISWVKSYSNYWVNNINIKN